MARICDRCGRGSLRSASRSHSNIATLRHLKVNLQKTRVDGHRMDLCTSCIRTATRLQTR